MKSVFDIDTTFPNEEFRVGLIGSHCVGKTSQVTQLGKLLRVPVITECARHMCASLGYKSIADVEDKTLFQWKILQWQIKHEQQYGRFISDRSTLDNAAYFSAYAPNSVHPREVDAYMNKAKAHAQSYTHLIYFPIMWAHIEVDGFRDTDQSERRRVDHIVQDLIKSFGVEGKTYVLTKDDHMHGAGSRLLEILQHLNLYQAIRENNLGS